MSTLNEEGKPKFGISFQIGARCKRKVPMQRISIRVSSNVHSFLFTMNEIPNGGYPKISAVFHTLTLALF